MKVRALTKIDYGIVEGEHLIRQVGEIFDADRDHAEDLFKNGAIEFVNKKANEKAKDNANQEKVDKAPVIPEEKHITPDA